MQQRPIHAPTPHERTRWFPGAAPGPCPVRPGSPSRSGLLKRLQVRFRLLPCGFPGRVLGSLNRMFSLWGWFCSWKVYPQTRRAYYLFSYYLFFNYMSVMVFHPRNWRGVMVFHPNLLVRSDGVSPWKTPPNHGLLWINTASDAPRAIAGLPAG